jgi:hypothetical protein
MESSGNAKARSSQRGGFGYRAGSGTGQSPARRSTRRWRRIGSRTSGVDPSHNSPPEEPAALCGRYLVNVQDLRDLRRRHRPVSRGGSIKRQAYLGFAERAPFQRARYCLAIANTLDNVAGNPRVSAVVDRRERRRPTCRTHACNHHWPSHSERLPRATIRPRTRWSLCNFDHVRDRPRPSSAVRRTGLSTSGRSALARDSPPRPRRT